MSVQFTEIAVLDIDDIWSYLAITQGNPKVAQKVMDELRQTFELLSDFPMMGRERNDLKQGIRRIVVRKRYIVLYRVIDEDILIERVVHGSRDLESLFQEPEG
jgi:toxin ParE1/3/4